MNRVSKLFDAVKSEDIDAVDKVLRRRSKLLGANRKSQLNAQDGDGLTSVHQAALMGNVQILKMLIQTGANVNVQDNKGMTPLHYAAWQSTPEVASLLLQNGARADACNHDGSTPLHVACQYGQCDLISLLLYYCADPRARNWKSASSPFDLACEYGRVKAVELLLDFMQRQIQNNSNIQAQSLSQFLIPQEEDFDTRRHSFLETGTLGRNKIHKHQKQPCSPLNLASKNGHVDVILTLLDRASMDVNRPDPGSNGNTPLHEAAAHLRSEAVQFLLHAGADGSMVNDANQTPLDLVKKSTPKNDPSAQKIKQLLKEASTAVYGKAVRDYCAIDEQELSFNYGDVIWILDRSEERRWKGAIFGPKYTSRIGNFPSSTVQLIDKPLGMQRSASQRQVKKVNVPLVPDIPGMVEQKSTSPVPPPPSMTTGQQSYQHSMLQQGSLSRHSYGSLGTTHSLATQQQNSATNGHLNQHQLASHHQTALMNGSSSMNGNSSPARHRNSTGSNSSQASSGFESMKSGNGQPYVNVTVHQLRGDSPPSRNSVHSSGSSSLGSLERLDESGYGSSGQINVAEMVQNGVPDHEVLAAWLHGLHYEEYLSLFMNAGYDLPTVARMTPEDLTAIGITKPGHRKRLTLEIHKLNITDQWPEKKPETLREWLCILKLSEYVPLFESQGFHNVDQLAQLTWEDYEDFGVKKLGHLKKLILASKKLKDNRHETKTGSSDSNSTNTQLLLINVPPSINNLITSNHRRTTAEVRPYSHVPPEMMSTFHGQEESDFFYRPDLIRLNQTSSPTRRMYGQEYFQNQNNTFTLTTEALVHDRPKVTVKPLLSVQRGSREGGLEKLDEFKNGNSPCVQSPRHKYFQASPMISTSNCYSMGGSSGDVNNDYRFSTNRSALSNQDIMCRSAPPLDAPPQKPPIGPLARPGAVFQLSMTPLPKLMQTVDENSSLDELSPAPSMDEFPPPPSPILCVESIKNLRNVREHNPTSALVMNSDDEDADLDLKHSDTGTLVRRRNPQPLVNAMTNGDSRQATTSTTSIESNSSTETLPFANENVGTIRQKNNLENTSTPNRKPHVNDVFVNGQQSRASGSTNSTHVMNDIDTMLQDLTDQLDALLKEPKSSSISS